MEPTAVPIAADPLTALVAVAAPVSTGILYADPVVAAAIAGAVTGVAAPAVTMVVTTPAIKTVILFILKNVLVVTLLHFMLNE
jgi:hypothetical protein